MILVIDQGCREPSSTDLSVPQARINSSAALERNPEGKCGQRKGAKYCLKLSQCRGSKIRMNTFDALV